MRLLPKSKKAELYRKELEVDDPLVEKLADVENKTVFKHLPDDYELRLIRDSIPHLGIVELDKGTRLIVREEMIRTLHLTHAANETMVLQTKKHTFLA